MPHNLLFKALCCYRPKRSFGQGNIFTSVCHSVHGGGSGPGGVPPNFRGGLVPGGSPNFQGVSNFAGGFLQIFGVGGLVWSRGSPNFWGVSNFSGGFSKFSGGVSTGIRSTFGRYASYWNAFLFYINFSPSLCPVLMPTTFLFLKYFTCTSIDFL